MQIIVYILMRYDCIIKNTIRSVHYSAKLIPNNR
ncbi:hypothetical protein GcM3_075028 [Golovinomyces cichoracearum]|uniref:Uncharacterized protein n=1 Tax=Golovinomyces cichoracearum TaxID=62708 RepID=A0A420IQX7_9PEZI|nr:hypothetical protein GcM3_075028 [Golovinomyces cichoracearum]